jgi:hypothetical protein
VNGVERREPLAPDLWAVVDDLKSLADFGPSDTSERTRPQPADGRPAVESPPSLPSPPSAVAAPAAASAAIAADAMTQAPTASSPPTSAPALPHVEPRPRRRRRRVVFAFGLPIVVAAGALLLPSARSRAPQSHARSAPPAAAAAAATGTRAGSNTKGASSGAKRASNSAKRAGTGSGTATSPPRTLPPQAARRPQAFGWVAVPKATYYRVRFIRDGQVVFEATPSRPRLVLPARWRFAGRVHKLEAGTYHWVVQPGFGSPRAHRYGAAVVAADWLATPSS